jgi:lipopolysaccharide transport system permease protein
MLDMPLLATVQSLSRQEIYASDLKRALARATPASLHNPLFCFFRHTSNSLTSIRWDNTRPSRINRSTMQIFSASPVLLVKSIFKYRHLIWDLAFRDATGRYKNSYLGVLWALVTPVLLLGIYAFVFTQVFKSKWDGLAGGGTGQFAIILFAGLMVFNIFAECIARAPTTVVAVPNYVKKILFPLESLCIVNLVSALIHFSISFAMLIVAQLLIMGTVPLLVWLVPLTLLPLLLLTLGLSWFLAALGVYIRDIGQVTGVVITAMMFLSPIFFPSTAIPETWRWLIKLNPLTLPIEATRDVLIFNRWPDFIALGLYAACCSVLMLIGYSWFQNTRRGFADVM